MFSSDFLDFIKLLNKHKVEYMIVGGYAVGFYGYPRYTGDMDIWINTSETNAEKMMVVMKEFGVVIPGLSKEDFMRDADLSGVNFGREPLRIDVLSSIDGVKFHECYPNRTVTDFEGVIMNYINFNDLKKNKLSTGRGKDKVDVEEIEKKMKKKK